MNEINRIKYAVAPHRVTPNASAKYQNRVAMAVPKTCHLRLSTVYKHGSTQYPCHPEEVTGSPYLRLAQFQNRFHLAGP